MNRERIANLSYLRGTEIFSFKADGIARNLKDFILEFPVVNYKSGVWNPYKLLYVNDAIERVNNSGYGADITIEYDDRWADGYTDGECKVYLSCPCESDMW